MSHLTPVRVEYLWQQNFRTQSFTNSTTAVTLPWHKKCSSKLFSLWRGFTFGSPIFFCQNIRVFVSACKIDCFTPKIFQLSFSGRHSLLQPHGSELSNIVQSSCLGPHQMVLNTSGCCLAHSNGLFISGQRRTRLVPTSVEGFRRK